MTMTNGSPGSHPHADRPNWHPGDDEAADELMQQKLADALRDGKSERQIAKLLGVTRKLVWRAKLLASIPEDLHEVLRATKPRPSSKEMELVARYLRDDDFTGEREHCPHCGEILRHRGLKPSTVRVVEDWEARQTEGEIK